MLTKKTSQKHVNHILYIKCSRGKVTAHSNVFKLFDNKQKKYDTSAIYNSKFPYSM